MILEAKQIHKYFKTQADSLHVLKGIDLKIGANEFVAIVGPSGAGKSTLLHILGGLDEPNSGEVILGQKNLYKLNDAQRALTRNASIGFVFQFYHLLPEFTALENVFLPSMVKDDKTNIRLLEELGRKYLNQVGLHNRETHKPKQLSGGEQQRVAIARALVNQPRIIFCDEPTGNLDSESGKSVIDALIRLNKEHKQALVIVTHDEKIAQLSHRVVRMKDGQLI